MSIFLSHITALRFWQAFDGDGAIHRSPGSERAFRSANAPRRTDLDALERLSRRSLDAGDLLSYADALRAVIDEGGDLDVLVPNAAARATRYGTRAHSWTRPLPSGAFVRLVPGVYVSSPEFCLLQVAPGMDVPELARLGCELCAFFRRDEDTDSGLRGRRVPLTSVERIRTTIESATGARGTKALRHALPYIFDNAASPMEINLTLLLCLPPKLGGYGIEPPVLNGHVAMRNGKLPTWDFDGRYGDLVWHDHRLILEYDSDLWHSGVRSNSRDSARRTELAGKGYTAISVTKNQVYDARLLEQLARAVFKELGRSWHIPTARHRAARARLRQLLLYS